MPPYQIYVNDQKFGPYRWSFSLVQDQCKELSASHEKVYAIHVESGNKMCQHPSPFTRD